ncbi:MAG TPA: hypothetical protein VNY24_09430 [Candidatus Acidoferrales bacterium]|jgi:hypothetical protein|nr:hypothetical protein [Candidatus Acidoferrales bacterium]
MKRIPAISANLQTLKPILLGSVVGFFLTISGAAAQENAAGPLAPPPEHKVERVIGTAQPEAPPSLPPTQIISAFTKKEDLYLAERPLYSYRRTVRIQEFGPDGKPAGEYNATYQAVRSSSGQLYEKALAAPESSLQYIQFEPDDAHYLGSVPAFPLTTDQLAKYNVKFLGNEKVDEIDCYIFEIHPKTLDRKHPLFDGILWVDQKYLEVVKTYGKWVTDLGPMRPGSLPFSMFETYRENVEGKYWFPNYSRAEDVYKLKDREIPVRVTIKWSDFKPFPPAEVPQPASPLPSAAPAAKP